MRTIFSIPALVVGLLADLSQVFWQLCCSTVQTSLVDTVSIPEQRPTMGTGELSLRIDTPSGVSRHTLSHQLTT